MVWSVSCSCRAREPFSLAKLCGHMQDGCWPTLGESLVVVSIFAQSQLVRREYRPQSKISERTYVRNSMYVDMYGLTCFHSHVWCASEDQADVGQGGRLCFDSKSSSKHCTYQTNVKWEALVE